jgi:predicted kinase
VSVTPAIPGIVITGAVGVGKTRVAFELSELLEARGISHGVIDADLIYVFPDPPGDLGGRDLGLLVLRAVWADLRDAGVERLILARVVESPKHLAAIRRVLPDVRLRVVRLTAPREVLADRIAEREIGSGRDWHLRRAAELTRAWESQPIGDDLVETSGRSVTAIAEDILLLSGWLES